MYIIQTGCKLKLALLLAFDPVPFIRTFEGAVDKLIALRKDVQLKSEQMEKSVKVAEREYSRKMSDLNKGFEVSSYCISAYSEAKFVCTQGGGPIILLYGE